MNAEKITYIVFDLEWIGHPQGKSEEYKAFPFEIIEIGAVKLDADRNPVDEFTELIRPQVFSLSGLYYKVREMLHVESADLEKAAEFPEVAARFLTWCGTGYRFVTWGSMDLTEFQRNLAHYNMGSCFTKPVLYYDAQKIFALAQGESGARSLEAAVDFCKLPKQDEFHSALSDARYTAGIFREMDEALILRSYSLDYYRHPTCRAEEITLDYGDYSEFVSREYDNRDNLMRARSITSFVCPICRAKAAKETRWYTANLKNYYCVGYCKKHGWLEGKIHVKKTAEGQYFAVKTIQQTDMEEASRLTQRWETLLQRQKEKNPVPAGSAGKSGRKHSLPFAHRKNAAPPAHTNSESADSADSAHC